MHDKSFEDGERTLKELKSLFLHTLYLWTTTFVSPLVIRYHGFLVFSFPFFFFFKNFFLISLVLFFHCN
jgi:hypothetical protein